MNPENKFSQAMQRLPLVAILRGMRPAEAMDLGSALVHAGWSMIEVPLNSPEPLHSIATLADAYPEALVGAGTVLSAQQVREVHAAHGRLVVSPNFNPEVVRAALQLGMVCMPGVMTPSEAFAALDAGAHALKLFPGEMITPAALKAMRAVLPQAVHLLPVGGIGVHNMAAYRSAGASGFGIGSALYTPGRQAQEVAAGARAFARAWAG